MRRRKQLAQLRLHLVVDFYSVHLGVLRKIFRKTQRRIARERAQLYHTPRLRYRGKHGQQAPLRVARAHARIHMAQMRAAPQRVQRGRFGVDVRRYVIVKKVVGHNLQR